MRAKHYEILTRCLEVAIRGFCRIDLLKHRVLPPGTSFDGGEDDEPANADAFETWLEEAMLSDYRGLVGNFQSELCEVFDFDAPGCPVLEADAILKKTLGDEA